MNAAIIKLSNIYSFIYELYKRINRRKKINFKKIIIIFIYFHISNIYILFILLYIANLLSKYIFIIIITNKFVEKN